MIQGGSVESNALSRTPSFTLTRGKLQDQLLRWYVLKRVSLKCPGWALIITELEIIIVKGFANTSMKSDPQIKKADIFLKISPGSRCSQRQTKTSSLLLFWGSGSLVWLLFLLSPSHYHSIYKELVFCLLIFFVYFPSWSDLLTFHLFVRISGFGFCFLLYFLEMFKIIPYTYRGSIYLICSAGS